MGILFEIIDILISRKAMLPKLQTIAIIAIKRGNNTPLIDLKLKNKMNAITKKARGNKFVKSSLIKSEI